MGFSDKKQGKLTKRRMLVCLLLVLALCASLLSGCGKKDASGTMDRMNSALVPVAIDDDYRTTYEIFVYSFYDSNNDGIGDLAGVLEQLDYINDGDPATRTDLECTEIWLMPIFPSPTYHKYDTTDYMAIDPQYGTMEDFENLLSACHERGVRVILDLAINHTSTEHPWFREAAAYVRSLAADQEIDINVCPYAGYYNWSREVMNGYNQLDFGGWFYESQFWSGMPDLNLDSQAVRGEIRDILAFWLEKGVDGFRLDAVTSYYTGDATKNNEFLTWLVDTAESIKPDVYLVGEAWVSQDAYAKFYESGMDSLFDFAYSGQDGIIANTVRGSRSAVSFVRSLVDEEVLYESYNASYVNAPFYTNHDLARSAGYYAYDDGSKTKMAGALNLLMTGNAFIYYGEELGMKGSGDDENKRAPMDWISLEEAVNSASEELYAAMCKGPSGMGNISHKYGTYWIQKDTPTSVWNYFRNAILVRQAFPVIARGRTAVVEEMSTETVAAFTRTMAEGTYESVLIVMNISEEEQMVALSGVGSSYGKLSAVLLTSEEAIELKGETLKLPPYSIAVLTE